MIASGGKLFLTTMNGEVFCLSGEGNDLKAEIMAEAE
jgi:hypothetical protein